MEKKWDTVIPADLKKTLCKWDIYVPLVTKGLSDWSTGRDTVAEQTVQLAMCLVNIRLLDDAVSKWMALSANTLAISPSPPLSLVVRYHHSSIKKTVEISGVSSTSLKAIPLQACTGPKGSKKLRFPDFKTIGT